MINKKTSPKLLSVSIWCINNLLTPNWSQFCSSFIEHFFSQVRMTKNFIVYILCVWVRTVIRECDSNAYLPTFFRILGENGREKIVWPNWTELQRSRFDLDHAPFSRILRIFVAIWKLSGKCDKSILIVRWFMTEESKRDRRRSQGGCVIRRENAKASNQELKSEPDKILRDVHSHINLLFRMKKKVSLHRWSQPQWCN